MKLLDLANRHLITVGAYESLDKAIALMEEHRIRHLPVTRDHGVLVGMLSDRDLLEAVGGLLSNQRSAAAPGPRRVQEIMSVPPLVLEPGDEVDAAGRIMLERRVSAVPLSVNGRIVGLVTATDLLRCYLREWESPQGEWRSEPVSRHMRSHVFTLGPDALLPQAVVLMRQKRIRHVPIVDGERLVGMISDHDVRRATGLSRLEKAAHGPDAPPTAMPVRFLMSTAVEKTRPDASLAEVAARLLERRFGALPVTQGELLAGIITETDLLRAFVAACAA